MWRFRNRYAYSPFRVKMNGENIGKIAHVPTAILLVSQIDSNVVGLMLESSHPPLSVAGKFLMVIPLCVLIYMYADVTFSQLLKDIVHFGLQMFLLNTIKGNVRSNQSPLVSHTP